MDTTPSLSSLPRTRRRLLVTAAVGGLVSLLLGSVLALAQDTVQSKGNSTATGTFTYPPQSHDLAAALISPEADCGSVDVVYEDGPISYALNTTIDLDGGPATLDTFAICFKNVGTATGGVDYLHQNVVDTEVGACSLDESDPTRGNDTTCVDGGPGELSPFLDLQFNTSGTGNCLTAQGGQFLSGFSNWVNNVGNTVATLDPGEWCKLVLATQLKAQGGGGPTVPERAMIQTDRVTWDILLTLVDA